MKDVLEIQIKYVEDHMLCLCTRVGYEWVVIHLFENNLSIVQILFEIKHYHIIFVLVYVIRELFDKTPKTKLDGLCIYDFPWPRRVFDDFSVTGGRNMTINNCNIICQGSIRLS